MNQKDDAVKTVQSKPKQKEFNLSTSKTVSFDEILNGKGMWTSDVTGVPIDLMLYLHFFSHSFGRNRRWCNIGILELQKFCAAPGKLASKNTIRESLDRLTARKLIECIEPEAANQKTKKWLVRTPVKAELDCCAKESWFSEIEPTPPTPQPPQNTPESPTATTPSVDTGSNIDPVRSRPRQGQ